MSTRPGWVFYLSLILLIGFALLGFLYPERLASGSQEALDFTTVHFGWLYLFATMGFLIFCIGVAMSDHGHTQSDGEEKQSR